MKLRHPISKPAGRKLRVVDYARYSTDEQNPLSIDDQYAAVQRLLNDENVSEFTLDHFRDEGISGEIIQRPGIDQVRQGILQKRWDILVAEESSRLFRHPSGCLSFVEVAVDCGVRVICINDFIDTAEDDWQDALLDAQQHHRKSNKFTRRRIERAFLARWDIGAAVTWLRPGYRRRPSREATLTEPEQGPFYDEIDPQFAPIVAEAFRRMAHREEPWLVVKYLNESGLPRCEGATTGEWTEPVLFALIRCTLYRGVEEHSKLKTVRKFSGAKPEQVRNEPENVRTRPMPHLRIVQDGDWYRGNAWIDERNRKKISVRGDDHPLKGIPRNSRQPLSELFVCGICGAKMYADGRNEGGYRCSSASKRKGCWNRATALRGITHEAIGKAVAGQLLHDRHVLDAEIRQISQLATSDEALISRVGDLRSIVDGRKRRKARIEEAIEKSDESIDTLVERLRQAEIELRIAVSDLEGAELALREKRSAPTPDQIMASIESTAGRLLTLDREVSILLKRLLIGPIRAVPYQQFESNKVVLRAAFTLRLASLVPAELVDFSAAEGINERQMVEREMLIDLFVPPTSIRHLRSYQHAKDKHPLMTIPHLADAVQLPEHIVRNASALAGRLQKQDLMDAYIELKEKPAAASRWKS